MNIFVLKASIKDLKAVKTGQSFESIAVKSFKNK